MTVRHLLEIDDLTKDELAAVLALAAKAPADLGAPLAGKGVALYFEKPSARTRHSTEMAVVQLGGHPVTVRPDEVGIGTRESVADVTRTLACYHSAIAARVFEHALLEQMAAASPVPVVNLLSELSHPLQAVADLLTIQQHFGRIDGIQVAYLGDFNNVARSLAIACAMAGAGFRSGSPAGYQAGDADRDRVAAAGGALVTHDRPHDAAAGADVIYTDVWTSMGQEAESAQRLRDFEGWCIDQAVLDHAAPGARLLHCLPAHRGEEVSADVVDGPASLIWQQATNRMHAARAVLAFLAANP